MKFLPVLPIFASLLMASGCDQVDSNRIDIINNAAAPVDKMRVEIGGNQIEVSRINPGEVRALTFDAKADSALRMTYQLNGDPNPLVCNGDIYVTSGVTEKIVVNIAVDGACLVSTEDK